MRIWLVQRAESTPHDESGSRRLLRIGIIADIMSKRGHDVIWWTSNFDHVTKTHRFKSNLKRSVSSKYQIQYLKTLGYKKNISFQRFLDNIILSRSLGKNIYLEKDQPDLILASIPSVEIALVASKYALSKNIPIILDIRDLYPDVFKDLIPIIFKPFLKLVTIPMTQKLKKVCQSATAILGITESFVSWGLSYANRSRNKNDRVFQMAYINNKNQKKDTNFWKNRPLGIKKDHLQLIFIGTFTNSFNFEILKKAAQILDKEKKKVQFTFCGNGIKSKEIYALSKKVNNCDFVGWVNASQIQTALELSDVGLAPYIESSNFINNIPNKPAEYMSKGLVVFTSLTIGPLAELLTERQAGNTYSNLDQFLKHLNVIYENRKILKNMKIKSKKIFNEFFNAENVYNNFADHIEKLIINKN